MMQSEQTVSAGAQQTARAGCTDMLFGETRTEAGVGAVMSVTAAAILWAPHTQAATLVPSPISGPEDLLGRAQDAMYQAGFQGGNRVVGYQCLDTFGLVRWNPQADGSPTERALVDKLFEWGYRPGMTYPSPDKIADRCPDLPSACAVVSGKLGLSIEGQSFELDIGDCLFLPKGKTYSAEVLGNDPVWLLDASKSS